MRGPAVNKSLAKSNAKCFDGGHSRQLPTLFFLSFSSKISTPSKPNIQKFVDEFNLTGPLIQALTKEVKKCDRLAKKKNKNNSRKRKPSNNTYNNNKTNYELLKETDPILWQIVENITSLRSVTRRERFSGFEANFTSSQSRASLSDWGHNND